MAQEDPRRVTPKKNMVKVLIITRMEQKRMKKLTRTEPALLSLNEELEPF